jgi:hypothetical protein
MLGIPFAVLIAAIFPVGAIGHSRWTGRGLAVSLVSVGFAGFTVLTATLFGVAAYTAIVGG